MFKNKNGCFDCDRCPQNNDKSKGRFCVAWIEVWEKNTENGQQRVRKQCGIPYLFEMLHDNSKAADRVTENLTAFPSRLRKEFEQRKLNGSQSDQ